jgi:hypothetical protein
MKGATPEVPLEHKLLFTNFEMPEPTLYRMLIHGHVINNVGRSVMRPGQNYFVCRYSKRCQEY